MKFIEKEVILKDDTKCILRSPNENDASDIIEHLKITSRETHFMIRYEEEIKITVKEQEDFLKKYINSDTDIMLSAFIDNELAGNASISCFRNHIKLKHRAVFGISIKQKYWSKGLGNILLKELIIKAKEMGYEQIELGVFSDNEKAINLYKKLGFEIWGQNKNAFKLIDNTYVDEIIMGKFL